MANDIEKMQQQFPRSVHHIIEAYWDTIGVTEHDTSQYIIHAEGALDQIDQLLGRLFGLGQYAPRSYNE